MEKTIPVTKLGYELLRQKQQELARLAKKKPGRPTKTESQIIKHYQEELEEVNEVLDKAEVKEFSEKEPQMVRIGSKVVIQNTATGDRSEYLIMTRATANPFKGIVSNESPLAQKLLGLKLGNTFKFKDVHGKEETYKVKSIE